MVYSLIARQAAWHFGSGQSPALATARDDAPGVCRSVVRFSGAGSGRGNAQRHDGLGQPQFSLRRKGPRWVVQPRNALISRYSQARNMGQLLIQLVVCALSMFVTVAVTASLLTTMFYALPKALLGWFRGAYSWKLPLFYFGGILILVRSSRRF